MKLTIAIFVAACLLLVGIGFAFGYLLGVWVTEQIKELPI